MENIDYMYLQTTKSVFNSLKNRVSGAIRTEFNIESDILIVDIQFKDFKFRQLINKYSKYVFEGGLDDLVTIIIGTYKKQLLRAFFKDERKEEKTEEELEYAGVY